MTSLLRSFSLLCVFVLLGMAFSPAPAQAQDAPFITIWDTENSGESNDDQITIPGEGTDYTIEWEEVGNTDNDSTGTGSGEHTITFPSPGVYRIKISGSFSRINFARINSDHNKIIQVDQWGDIEWSTMRGSFQGASNLVLRANDAPDLSEVSRANRMFKDATSISGSSSNIGAWDVSNISEMREMFQRSESFNGSIDSWNVSNVETMRFMFENADSFNRDISSWDVSSVTNMSWMFANTENFNQDLNSWDTSSLESIEGMFNQAASFNQSIGSWDVSSVSTSIDVFSGSGMSSVSYDRTLNGWAVQNVESNNTIDAPQIKYCDGAPFRAHLVDEFGWFFDDGGQEQGCPDTLAASQARQADGDGQLQFGDLSTTLKMSGVIGSGLITAAKFSNSPREVQGISESSVSKYRLLVAGGGITFFDSTKVRLAVSEFGGITQPEDVVIYKRSQPGNGAFDALTTSVDDNGTPSDISDDTLSAKVTEGFGEFVLASNNNELPVELASFDGIAVEGSARLTWQTASETNNAGFEVQRQKESGWTQIGYVDSKASGGTTTETQSYSYTAEDLPVGTHQFRLKQVDLDGSSTLTDPVTVTIDMQEAVKLTAPAPNPASSTATISFAVKEKADTRITLYNTLGQRVATVYDGTPQAGEQQRVQVNVSDLSSGTYFIRLDAGQETATERITVVK